MQIPIILRTERNTETRENLQRSVERVIFELPRKRKRRKYVDTIEYLRSFLLLNTKTRAKVSAEMFVSFAFMSPEMIRI